jgi:hypothetical protein
MLKMEDYPSFRRRVDVRRLVIALLIPWVLGGLAYSLPLIERELYRGGFRTDWLGSATIIWFYLFGFTALLCVTAWFIFGLSRLVRRRNYRKSWYGWMWLLFMYLNLCAVGSVIIH